MTKDPRISPSPSARRAARARPRSTGPTGTRASTRTSSCAATARAPAARATPARSAFCDDRDDQLELDDFEPVGGYALGLKWFDGHASGIYSFKYLRRALPVRCLPRRTRRRCRASDAGAQSDAEASEPHAAPSTSAPRHGASATVTGAEERARLCRARGRRRRGHAGVARPRPGARRGARRALRPRRDRRLVGRVHDPQRAPPAPRRGRRLERGRPAPRREAREGGRRRGAALLRAGARRVAPRRSSSSAPAASSSPARSPSSSPAATAIAPASSNAPWSSRASSSRTSSSWAPRRSAWPRSTPSAASPSPRSRRGCSTSRSSRRRSRFPRCFGRRGHDPVLALAIGALVGGALQVVAQWPALRAIGYADAPQFVFDDDVRRVLRRLAPMTFGIGVYYDRPRALAPLPLGAGHRRAELLLVGHAPLRLSRRASSSWRFRPRRSRRSRRSRRRANAASSRRRGRTGCNWRCSSPSRRASRFVALGEPIVVALFQRGAFDAQARARDGAGALLARAAPSGRSRRSRQIVPAFYALGDTRTPVIVSARPVRVHRARHRAARADGARRGSASRSPGRARCRWRSCSQV